MVIFKYDHTAGEQPLAWGGTWRPSWMITAQMVRRHLIDEAEFDQHYRRISAQMNTLRPAANPQARAILPRLNNFKALWAEMSHAGRRALLDDIFVVLFFDSQERLRGYRLHEPFKALLGDVKMLDQIG